MSDAKKAKTNMQRNMKHASNKKAPRLERNYKTGKS